MRMVEDLSGDILAGWAERQRLIEAARANAATPAGLAALEAYLRPLIASQDPLPATTFQGKPVARSPTSAPSPAHRAARSSGSARREGLAAAVAQRPGPCPLDIPVTGRIAGRPWRTALDFNEATALMRHLGTAAFIVCAYLTGMPARERSWRCAPDAAPTPPPARTGRPGRHLIRGLEFKTATDEDGNHRSGGAEREVPWVAITPVVNAIRVLERMVPDGHLLFGHDAHDAARRTAGHRLPEARRAPGADRGLRGLGEPRGSQARPARRGHPRRPARANRPGPLPPEPGLAYRAPAQRPGGPGHPVRAHAHRASASGPPRDTPPAAATASTTSSTWRPPARPPTPSPPCTRTSRTAAAYPGPRPAAPSGPPPPRPASPAPPSPSPAPASCWRTRTP